MKRHRLAVGTLLSILCLISASSVAFSEQLSVGSAVLQSPPLPPSPLQTPTMTDQLIAFHPKEHKKETKSLHNNKTMSLTAKDPKTGKTVNIDVDSENLSYDPATDTYTVTGSVYIIIPQNSTEILADKATFNSKTSNMVAAGNVFIISDRKVLASKSAKFDFKNDVSYYTDAKTITDYIGIKARQSIRTKNYIIMHDGRLVLTPQAMNQISLRYRQHGGMHFGTAAFYGYFSANMARPSIEAGGLGQPLLGGSYDVYSMDSSFLKGTKNPSDAQPIIPQKPISPKDVISADFSNGNSLYQLKTKTIDIFRHKDGYDKIVLHQSLYKYRNIPFFFAPSLDFGYIESNNFLTYLGPDIGYNLDNGGFYAGPGFDFRLFDGWVKVSPYISYGGGQRILTHINEQNVIKPQWGYGILTHFRSPENRTDFGYGSTVHEPILLSEQELFHHSNTRLRLSINRYYTNGFFGIERPRMIGDLTDLRQFYPLKGLLLRTFTSAGVAKDDFSPTRQAIYFVAPKSDSPITTVRLQLQNQLVTTRPIIHLGHFASISAVIQSKLALYGTGNAYGVIQGGPYANILAGPLFTQVSYLYGRTSGHTPFVFDSFYQGQNYLQIVNSLDLGKYFTIGAIHGLSLNKDNARNDLVINRQVFATVGSRNFRFTLAYDFIQKRSFFGILINPQGGKLVMDYNNLNVYQPTFTSDMHKEMDAARKGLSAPPP